MTVRAGRAALGLGRTLGAVAAVVMGGGLMVAEAAAVLSEPTAPATAIELSDDDSAAALFSVSEMAPGHPTSSCMALAYRADGAAALRLYGASVGSGLDRALRLVVDEGSGGRFGDCSAFTGASVYVGTLADFARHHHDFASGLALGATPSEAPVSYRFTVEVLSDNAAQGRDAEATFTWEAQDAPPPPPVVVPTTTPTEAGAPQAPSAQPTMATPAAEAPDADEVPRAGVASEPIESTEAASTEAVSTEAVSTEGVSPSPSVPPTPQPTPGGPSPTAAGPVEATPPTRQGGSRLTPVEDRGLAHVLGTVLDAVATAAVVAIEKSAFPGGLLVVAGVFLLVQDRIDRKDPKLALAPVYPDPDLHFDFERTAVG